MDKENNNFFNSDSSWLLVFGLVIVLLFGYVIFRDKEATTADGSTVNSLASTTETDTISSSASPLDLAVSSQIPGDTVLVRDLKTTMPLWLSVNELDVSGQPTNIILGAAFLRTPGVYQEQEIELLRPTKEGGRYGVILYRDNGSGQFSFDPTLLLRDENGKIVVAPFTVEILGSRGTD